MLIPFRGLAKALYADKHEKKTDSTEPMLSVIVWMYEWMEIISLPKFRRRVSCRGAMRSLLRL